MMTQAQARAALAVCAAGALAAAALSFTSLAYAADGVDGRVDVPWGDWVGALAGLLGSIVASAALVALRNLPGMQQQSFIRDAVEQLLERAIGFGVNRVQGAVRGKQLSVTVGSAVAEEAAEYALRHAPQLVEKFIGDRAKLVEKILARLDLEEMAGAAPA